MDLKEIVKLQQEFDAKHKTNFNWDESISEENLQLLGYLTLSIFGEVGEMANIVKKILRGDADYELSKPRLNDELADIFIYVLKLSYQMDIDLEEIFLKKLEINKSRFKSFEKQ